MFKHQGVQMFSPNFNHLGLWIAASETQPQVVENLDKLTKDKGY